MSKASVSHTRAYLHDERDSGDEEEREGRESNQEPRAPTQRPRAHLVELVEHCRHDRLRHRELEGGRGGRVANQNECRALTLIMIHEHLSVSRLEFLTGWQPEGRARAA